jgi:hypothetical protein
VGSLKKWWAITSVVLGVVNDILFFARALLEDVTDLAFAIAEEARSLLGWWSFTSHCDIA